jgi:hypothetical protein
VYEVLLIALAFAGQRVGRAIWRGRGDKQNIDIIRGYLAIRVWCHDIAANEYAHTNSVHDCDHTSVAGSNPSGLFPWQYVPFAIEAVNLASVYEICRVVKPVSFSFDYCPGYQRSSQLIGETSQIGEMLAIEQSGPVTIGSGVVYQTVFRQADKVRALLEDVQLLLETQLLSQPHLVCNHFNQHRKAPSLSRWVQCDLRTIQAFVRNVDSPLSDLTFLYCQE